MKNNEQFEIQGLYDLKPDLLKTFSKILQQSMSKQENLKGILSLSKEKETEALFEKIFLLIMSGSIKLADLSKEVQRKLSQINNPSTNDRKQTNDEEVVVILTEKYVEILNKFEEKTKLEVTQSLSSLVQKLVSNKKLYDFKNDKKYKILAENNVDLAFLNEDFERMNIFSKLLQKKVEELKSKTITTNSSVPIQTLCPEVIKNIKENKEKYPYFSYDSIEFTHFCYLIDESLFYFISYVPSLNTFNFFVNKEFNENTEISFGNLKRLYKDEPFFKDFEFHRESFSVDTYCLKYTLNLRSFEEKVENEFKHNVKEYTLNKLQKKDDYFKNKIIFTKQTNILKDEMNKMILEMKIPGNCSSDVFSHLIACSKLDLEMLKTYNLI